MIDPSADAIAAIMHDDLSRLPIVTLAGIVTSIGPCVAPRYIALASILNGSRRAVTIGAFIAGIVVAYAALGCAGSLLATVTRNASAIDLVLAATLTISGLVTLLRRSQHHGCEHGACATGAGAGAPPAARAFGSAFCLGAASALVVSPCCTPIVAAIVAFPSIDPSPAARAALLGAFAVGHAAPLVLLGTGGSLFINRLRAWSASAAPSVVSGALMIGLGGYYGALV